MPPEWRHRLHESGALTGDFAHSDGYLHLSAHVFPRDERRHPSGHLDALRQGAPGQVLMWSGITGAPTWAGDFGSSGVGPLRLYRLGDAAIDQTAARDNDIGQRQPQIP